MDRGEPCTEESSSEGKRETQNSQLPRKSLLMYFLKRMISNHFGTSISLD